MKKRTTIPFALRSILTRERESTKGGLTYFRCSFKLPEIEAERPYVSLANEIHQDASPGATHEKAGLTRQSCSHQKVEKLDRKMLSEAAIIASALLSLGLVMTTVAAIK